MCRIAPCQNSGICVNGKEGYSCICEKGFTGKINFLEFSNFCLTPSSPPNYPLYIQEVLEVQLGLQIRPSRGVQPKLA